VDTETLELAVESDDELSKVVTASLLATVTSVETLTVIDYKYNAQPDSEGTFNQSPTVTKMKP
jgi:hypothetical protein